MIRHLIKTEPLAWPILACLAAASLAVFGFNIADPDLWGHVRFGADMLREGRLLRTDPYSYLTGDLPWINHELLCELTLAFLETWVGPVGILIWKCLMGAATVACIVWSHRHARLGALTIVLVTTLLLLNVWPAWLARPQLFTFAFLSLLALLITEHQRGRRRVLWFVPPIMAAWINSHGGFMAGLSILAVHIAFEVAAELRVRQTGWMLRTAELAAVSLATFAATCMNPYGSELLVWVWESVAWPRPEISEWAPVRLTTLEHLSFKCFVAVAVVSFVFTRRPREWSRATVLALTAMQAFLHWRHVPLFAILASYWVPEHLDDCLRRVREAAVLRHCLASAGARSRRLFAASLAGLTLLFSAVLGWQMRGIDVDRSYFPVSAVRFICQHGLTGRMVTDFNWGEYCLYAFGPQILVSVDGRFDTCYSREVLDINFDFTIGNVASCRNRSPGTGAFRADRLLDEGSPNLALIDRQRSNCVRAIERRADWVLLYQDSLAQLWGRRSIYDDPHSPHYIPTGDREITDAPQTGHVLYPALQ